MKEAILNVKYICPGELSHERYVEIIDFEGRKFTGLFQESHMKKDSELIVKILEEKDDILLIQVPHGEHCGIYGHGLEAYGFITVKKENLKAV